MARDGRLHRSRLPKASDEVPTVSVLQEPL
jgi:hypothetical protein